MSESESEKLDEYIDGTLEPDEMTIWEARLRTDHGLMEEYLLRKKLRNIVINTEVNEFTRLLKSVMDESTKEETNTEKKGISRSLIALVLSSAAVLLIGLFLFLFQKEDTKVNTAIGEKRTISLPDETKVILNSKSVVSFSEQEWSKSRLVKLKGEAWFDVVKGSTFTVETEKGIIQVLGTKFTIDVDQMHLIVNCYEGRVKVKSEQGEVILERGQAFRQSKHRHDYHFGTCPYLDKS